MGGIDRVSTSAFDATNAPESRKAALRVVQTGGTITQSVASRWVAGGSLCPFCRLGKEDPYHRFWACPKWYNTRQAVLGSCTRASLEATVGRPSLTTGVFLADPALLAAQAAAESAGHCPPVVALPPEVWTDGSCTHPRDSMLRRAAWAVVGSPPWAPYPRFRYGHWEANHWPSRTLGTCLGFDVRAAAIIDAQYLIGCMARCAAGQPPAALLDSKNGDLWRLLLRPFPVKWVKAHLTAAQAVIDGVSERDRLGNEAADVACSFLVIANNPCLALVTARASHLSAAMVVQTVLARIQEAALEAHHSPGTTIAKRKWKRRRPTILIRKIVARPRPPPLPLQLPQGPTVIHSVVIDRGPLPETMYGRLSCSTCLRSVRGTGRWAAFARSICGHFPGAVHFTRQTALHDLWPAARGWVCLRCRLPVAPGRRASAALASCPLPEVLRSDGQPCLQARLHLQVNVATIADWHSARRLVPQVVIAPNVPPPLPSLRWLDHWKMRYGRTDVCLQCGKSSAVTSVIPLDSTSCPGPVDPPPSSLTAPLRAGSFDLALSTSPRSWTERAHLLGWQAVGRGALAPAYLVPSRGGAHGGPVVASMPPD